MDPMDDDGSYFRFFNPERLAPELDRGLRGLERDKLIRRIWDRDATVWKPEAREISNRLGWLSSPRSAEDEVPALEAFAASLRCEGLTRAVVLGMGGSSLAPEVFARLFRTGNGALELEVLDTTEPGTVAAAAARLDIDKTLFLVSSKSGTTAELISLFSYFYDRAHRELGDARAGGRFVAVTDPGTPLEALAKSLRFRGTFPGRPDIGGRFSALSVFGLLPAALKGIDLRRLLRSSRTVADACRVETPDENPGARLGAILGTAAGRGLDKLTFIIPPRLRPLAGWLEQLIAESTGKEGQGIVPVIEDVPGSPASYGKDRLFVELTLAGEAGGGEGVGALIDAGAPLVRLALEDPYSLGGHFFLWEFATAVAAHFLKINPFDQPDVESTKKKTREILAGRRRPGTAVPGGPAIAADGLRIFAPGRSKSAGEALAQFLGGSREGDYIAILAFLPPAEGIEKRLAGLAESLRLKRNLPVTVGFGPRYLHSTGQLHKGDGNKGLFLMLAEADMPEVPIPAVPGIERPAAAFADLFAAQGWGDVMALADNGRRVLRVEIESPIEAGIRKLSSLLG
jgi:glucose-6-phosphate isomerase/transaldolase/glucose-6-phosphate isomerase